MKKNILLIAALMLSTAAIAKSIKTAVFTTVPQMHCDNCEQKIKKNVRFVKGVKEIKTSIEQQTVTVTYDAAEKGRDGEAQRQRALHQHVGLLEKSWINLDFYTLIRTFASQTESKKQRISRWHYIPR